MDLLNPFCPVRGRSDRKIHYLKALASLPARHFSPGLVDFESNPELLKHTLFFQHDMFRNKDDVNDNKQSASANKISPILFKNISTFDQPLKPHICQRTLIIFPLHLFNSYTSCPRGDFRVHPEPNGCLPELDKTVVTVG